MAFHKVAKLFHRFCMPYITYQNDAIDANAKVAPKLSLKATLSSIADLRSIPFTYRCNLVVGMMLYPCDARYCANISIAWPFVCSARRHACTPKTSSPKSMANVLENVLTATPPSNPVVINALAQVRLQISLLNSHFQSQLLSSVPQFPPTKTSHTSNTPRTNLPVRPRIRPPVLKDGYLCIPRIRLEALRDRGPGRPGRDFAQQGSLSVDCLCCVEGGETEADGEREKGPGVGEEEEGCHWS